MPIVISHPEFPTMNETTDLYQFFLYINNGTTGIFFPLILGAIWMIIFISSLASTRVMGSASRAWTFASFFSAILSVMLTILNLLNKRYMYLLVLMFAFGLVWMILQDSRE